MITVARGFLYCMAFVFGAIGLVALAAPETVAARFDLLPQSIKGIAEVRGLYGGGILAWGLIALGALRCKHLSPGLLIALATIMGSIATGRLVSLMLDHETVLTIPAGIAETAIAWACWAVYKHEKSA